MVTAISGLDSIAAHPSQVCYQVDGDNTELTIKRLRSWGNGYLLFRCLENFLFDPLLLLTIEVFAPFFSTLSVIASLATSV